MIKKKKIILPKDPAGTERQQTEGGAMTPPQRSKKREEGAGITKPKYPSPNSLVSSSRPKGVPKEETQLLTGLSPEEQEKIQLANAIEGQERAKSQIDDLKKKAQVKIQTEKTEKIPGFKLPSTEEIKSNVKAAEDKEYNERIKNQSYFEGVKEGAATIIPGIVDVIRTAFTMKQSTKAIAQINEFTDLSATMDDEIEMVKNGKDPTSALIAMDMLASALIRLEETEVTTGRINLRYWLDNGKELQSQIKKEQTILEQKRDKLELAILQNRITRATNGL